MVARYLRVRPSELLSGSLADLNIDVAMVMRAVRDEAKAFKDVTRKDREGWFSMIANALRAALETSR
jgi:hypothetical protein